jgi:CRP-like cAMP-binding protein
LSKRSARLSADVTSHFDPPASTNRLLAALPPSEYNRLRPLLDVVPLPFKLILQKQGAPVERVFFPNGGICSLMYTMTDGRAVEVATVGREGFVNVPAILGIAAQPYEAMVQVPSPGATAEVMSVANFRREFARGGPLSDLTSRYAQVYMAMSTQATACNGLHAVEERCAKFLLLIHDRVESKTFLLTQDLLSVILGVRRATVTLVLGVLQRAGCLESRNRHITIRNRARLEEAACECYSVVRAIHNQLLPFK